MSQLPRVLWRKSSSKTKDEIGTCIKSEREEANTSSKGKLPAGKEVTETRRLASEEAISLTASSNNSMALIHHFYNGRSIYFVSFTF
ncbi:hypothetical protein Bca101_088379 [Brassica carinata]